MKMKFIPRGKWFYIVAILTIISSIYLAYYLIDTLFFNETTMYVFKWYLFLFIIVLTLLISNLFLVFTHDYEKQFLKLNIIISFLQIIQLKFFGLVYHFSTGIEILPYFSMTSETSFGIDATFWEIALYFSIKRVDTGFYIGLNLFPIFIFLVYSKVYRNLKKK